MAVQLLWSRVTGMTIDGSGIISRMRVEWQYKQQENDRRMALELPWKAR